MFNSNIEYSNLTTKKIIIYENNPFSFECTVKGYPTPLIKLYLNDNHINSSMSYNNFENKIVYNFSNIKRINNGSYSCRFDTDSKTTINEKINVFVYC